MKNTIQKTGLFSVTGIVLCGLMAAPFIGAVCVSQAQSEMLPVASPVAPSSVIGPDFVDLSARLLPTVVNVSAVQMVEKDENEGLDEMPDFQPGSPFEDFFKDFLDRQQNGQPPIQQQPNSPASALGSGFVIDAEKGYIVTNNHVIKDANEIKIILHGDKTVDAVLVGRDEKTDLAVLQIKTDEKLVSTVWGNSDTARVGSWVIAIGNPFGLGGTVTAGIVSARQRDIHAGPYDNFIQSDASINKGNSGGPMFNTAGQVVGVNTAIFSPTGGSVGIGFAIPSNLAKSVVDQLIKYGKTKRGWLGVRIQIVTDEIAESLAMKDVTGALVAGLTKDGPAAKSGIKAGDVILEFNGQTVDQMRNLPIIVAETEVDAKVSVTVWRKGKEKKITVKLGQLEAAEEKGLLASDTDKKEAEKLKTTSVKDLGLTLSALSKLARKQYGFDDAIKGVLITEVDTSGSAADKGLRSGDVIVEFDQVEVSNPQSILKKIKQARKEKRGSVLLLLSRQGDLRFVALKLADKKKK